MGTERIREGAGPSRGRSELFRVRKALGQAKSHAISILDKIRDDKNGDVAGSLETRPFSRCVISRQDYFSFFSNKVDVPLVSWQRAKFIRPRIIIAKSIKVILMRARQNLLGAIGVIDSNFPTTLGACELLDGLHFCTCRAARFIFWRQNLTIEFRMRLIN